MENIYYTVQDVATLLKLSTLTIYKYIKEEKLPVINLDGHYRIEKSDLIYFLETHKLLKKENNSHE